MLKRNNLYIIVSWVLILLITAACGNANSAIVGEWRAGEPDLVLEFFQDGTVTWDQGGRTFAGQYKYIDNENIRLDVTGDLGPQAIVLKDVSISGDQMNVTLQGKQLIFSRAQKVASQPQETSPTTSFDVELKTEQISYPLGSIQSSEVEINFVSAGKSKLYALTNSSNLIEGKLAHYAEVTFEPRELNGQANLRLDGKYKNPIIFQPSDAQQENWEIGLNPNVTYNLHLALGVGESLIDLTQLRLSSGVISGGVGRSEIQLPASGKFTLRIDVGVGDLRILVPSSMAARIELDSGGGNFQVDPRFQARGKAYETDGFQSAENAATLIINGGLGKISIE
jgi:hypothetical protein